MESILIIAFSSLGFFALLMIDEMIFRSYISKTFRSFMRKIILFTTIKISKIKFYFKRQYLFCITKMKSSNVENLIDSSKRLREYKNKEKTYY